MYSLSMNVLAFTVGVFCLTGEKRFMSVKAAVFNPTVFGFVLAVPIFVLGLHNVMPAALTGAIEAIKGIHDKVRNGRIAIAFAVLRQW